MHRPARGILMQQQLNAKMPGHEIKAKHTALSADSLRSGSQLTIAAPGEAGVQLGERRIKQRPAAAPAPVRQQAVQRNVDDRGMTGAQQLPVDGLRGQTPCCARASWKGCCVEGWCCGL